MSDDNENNEPVGKSFLNNKQMIHIIVELLLIAGLSFYFTSKTRALQVQNEELNQRINNLENDNKELRLTFHKQLRELPFGNLVNQVIMLEQRLSEIESKKIFKRKSLPIKLKPEHIIPKIIVEEDSEDEENEEENVDDMIKDELEELQT